MYFPIYGETYRVPGFLPPYRDSGGNSTEASHTVRLARRSFQGMKKWFWYLLAC